MNHHILVLALPARSVGGALVQMTRLLTTRMEARYPFGPHLCVNLLFLSTLPDVEPTVFTALWERRWQFPSILLMIPHRLQNLAMTRHI